MNNFKTAEVKAYTKQEATEKAPFQIIKDATQAWKNANKPMTGSPLKEFMAEYLEKNTKFASGIGCMITVEAGQADTRERPYTIENVKGEGKRKPGKAFLIVDKATNAILATVFGTKDDAEKELKKLYTDKDYKGDAYVEIIYKIVEGEPIAMTAKYTPSVNAKLGTYLAFGVEA